MERRNENHYTFFAKHEVCLLHALATCILPSNIKVMADFSHHAAGLPMKHIEAFLKSELYIPSLEINSLHHLV